MQIRLAASDEEIAACYPVMKQLRAHLQVGEFVSTVRRLELTGYRLAYFEVEDRLVAVTGFRVLEDLPRGRFLYVDDLVTDETFRSKGVGAQLLAWLRAHAKAEACNSVQLDTGLQRKGAQRFYEREGMRLSCYHYEIP